MQGSCPLCGGNESALFHQGKSRSYFRCAKCLVVFVPAEYHLDADQEKAEYDLHQNQFHDEGYRCFLSRLFTPVLSKLEKNPQRGLDFGCGPTPVLADMFEQEGHNMSVFDLYYANTPAVLNQQYDFVVSTEVVEHLREPNSVFQTLWSTVKPGGILGLMTKRVTTESAFSRWHYINDPTHILFFSDETFEYLALQWGAVCELTGPDTVLFYKP